MFQNRGSVWIGFQEAQKSITILKEEVEIAERKLLNAKRALSSTKGSSESILLKKPSYVEYESSTQTKHFKKHFVKETLLENPEFKNSLFQNDSPPFDKTVSSTAIEDKPKPLPLKIPDIQLVEIKQALIQSSTPITFSNSDTSNFAELQYSSSGSTSSLIAGLSESKELKCAMTRQKKPTRDASNIIFSSWEKVFLQNEDVKLDGHISSPASEKVPPVKKLTNGIEWKIAPAGKKPFFQRNSSKSHASFLRLSDIIERQKKKFEASNLESDDDVVNNHRKFLKSSLTNEHKKLPEKAQPDKILQVTSGEILEAPPLPLRKKCLVTTHPVYKGFSYPGVETSSYLKGKVKKKIKITETAIQNDTSKRKKVLLRSNKTSTSPWKKSDQVVVIQKPVLKLKSSDNEKCDAVKSLSEKSSNSNSTDSSGQETKSNHVNQSTNENVQSVSVVDASEPNDKNAKDTEELKSLNEDTLDSASTINGNQSATKNNILMPTKPKSIKRKAIKPPEQIAPSPKVRHYDVEKVRDYIQKKKIERKKRHIEEHRKRSMEVQKKKESLQKLYEHQKQSVKALSKDKLLSPVKMSIAQKTGIDKMNHNTPHDVLNSEEHQKRTFKHGQGNGAMKNKENSESKSIKVKQNMELEKVEEPTRDYPIVKNHLQVIEPDINNVSCETKENADLDKVPGEPTVFAIAADDNDASLNIRAKLAIPDILNSSPNCSYVSTISTPTELSQMSGIDKSLLQAMKEAKALPVRSRHCETLKNLMKSIDVLTEPYEYFLRTKKWVEESPPPPSLKDSEKTESSVVNITNKFIDQKASRDFKLEIAKSISKPKDKSIFMERVSDIVDLNQLYSRILNKETDPIQSVNENSIMQNNESVKSDESLSDDDLIEGSLKSDEENPEITISNNKSSTLLQLSPQKIPDPFNVINTWKRKPLGILHSHHSKFAESKSSSLKISHEQSFLSARENYSSDFPASSFSDQTGMDNIDSQYAQNDLIEGSLKKTIPDFKIKSTSDSEENLKNSNKMHSSSRVSSPINSQVSMASESLISDSITSEGSGENSIVELLGKTNVSSASNSESVVSEVVSIVENANGRLLYSDETLNNDKKSNDSQEVPCVESAISKISEDVREDKSNGNSIQSYKSIQTIMEYHSGSSIKSVKSSIHHHSSVSNSYESIEDQEELSVKSNNDKLNIESLAANNSNGVILSSEHNLRNEDSTQLPDVETEGNVLDPPPIVPSTITIDFTQPVRLTLSSRIDEPLLIRQHIPGENEQYLHPQFVKRVASEAAAAAAKSAVTEILKSQRSNSSKKHPFKISVVDSSSSSVKSKIYSTKSEYTRSEKTSSKLSKSNSKESKHSTSSTNSKHGEIIEEIHSGSNSIEEMLEHSSALQLGNLSEQKSSPSSSSKLAEIIESASSDVNVSHISEKFSERSNRRKISGNLSSPSPASLSDNESVSSATMISSQSAGSDFSHQDESDDSFAQLTLDVVKRMTQDEELRARQQLSFLQMQEKTLVEKARAEMMWLEALKKKLRAKGSERKVATIKKHQKEIILRLRQERAQLQCMQEAYRSICEKHQSLLEDKRKLLKEPISLAYQILAKKEKGHVSKHVSQDKLKEVPRAKSSSSSTPTAVSNDEQIVEEEDAISEVPELLKGLASNSSQESVIEQTPEQAKSSLSSHAKSHQSSPNATYSPSNTVSQSISNLIQSNNSLDSAIQGFKKLEASKRHLTKREQRILQRRKHVENLLQWHKKLDSEEMAVRELEQKALELVDHSKKKTKYYVSSTSTDINSMKKLESKSESALQLEPKINLSNQKTTSDVTSSIKNANSSSHTPSSKGSTSILEENNSGSSSGNGVEEALSPDKGSSGAESYVTTAVSSVKEGIKSGSSRTGSSIHTADTPVENSLGEEIISDDVSSNVISASLKDRSSNSDVYSESFESTTSRKSLLLSSPLSFRNASPKQHLNKDAGLGIRAPLVPRNLRRHDSSGSDDSYTISHSETASDQSDIEVRIHALAEELRRRKAEAEKLKREQKKKYREQLKEKELSLQKQIEAYNQYIQQAKLDLEHQIESAVSFPQNNDTTVVKPQIKWPRPEKILESRRLRKQAPYVHDALSEKKSAEINASSSETGKSITEKNSESKTRSEVKTGALTLSAQELSAIKTKSSSIVNNITSEIKELSDIGDQSKDSAGEISSIEVETSEINSDHSYKSQAQLHDSTNSLLDKSIEEIPDKYEKSSSNVTESKSDSFISETTSQPSDHTVNEKQTDDSLSKSSSHKSSSAGEDGNYSEEFVDDHDSDQSHDSNKTVLNESTASSEIESSSEAHSVVNTGSIDEEVESENFKCDSPNGCPTPQSEIFNKTFLVPDKQSVPFCDSKSSSTHKKSFTKEPESEIFVMNVTNYVCSSMIDDAMKTIICLKRKISNSNNLKISCRNKNPEIARKNTSISQKVNDEKILDIVNSLMDKYLTDSVLSIVRTFRTFKLKCLHQTDHENKSVAYEDDKISDGEFQMNSVAQNADFPTDLIDNYNQIYPQTLQDVNDNSIFNKSVNWLDGTLLSSQNEFQVQQLEQQFLLQQQYPFYYRKIPNKPPPPYTPPSAGVSTIAFVKDKHITKVQDMKSITENISFVLDHVVDVLLNGKKRGLSLNEIPAPKLECIAERFELVDPSQVIFIDLIFDVTREILLELFNETDPEPQPWLRARKLTPKPAFPMDKNKLITVLEKEVQLSLKLTSERSTLSQRKQTLWSAMKLGRKKRDFVDTILIKELKEEEPEWVNYDQDEVTVKFQIADYIFNLLIDDTVKVFKTLQHKYYQ